MESISAFLEANLGTLIVGLLIGIIVLYLEHRTGWFAGYSERKKSPESKISLESKISPESKTSTDIITVIPTFDEIGPQYRENPTPDKILADINLFPPAQRKGAAQQYSGQLVKWRVSLVAAELDRKPWVSLGEPDPDPLIEVFLAYSSDKYNRTAIVCYVDPKEYPEFKILDENHQMWVAGEIETVGRYIELKLGARFKID